MNREKVSWGFAEYDYGSIFGICGEIGYGNSKRRAGIVFDDWQSRRWYSRYMSLFKAKRIIKTWLATGENCIVGNNALCGNEIDAGKLKELA